MTIRELLGRVTQGEWQLQDGCSWRRIGTAFHDGDVLCPITSRRDNYPDLIASDGKIYDNLRFIVAAKNELPDLLESLDKAVEALTQAQYALKVGSEETENETLKRYLAQNMTKVAEAISHVGTVLERQV